MSPPTVTVVYLLVEGEAGRPEQVSTHRSVGAAPTAVNEIFAQSFMFTQSSGGPLPPGQAYGYVHFGGGIVSKFNSSGAAVTVTGAGAGTWVVRMGGLGSAGLSGNVQVTAVDPVMPARCKLAAWKALPSEQEFMVRCTS